MFAATPIEKFYTVGQIARRRNLSTDLIRRMFVSEAGVIVITKTKPGKRIYRCLRVPESVEKRVFARFTNGGIAA